MLTGSCSPRACVLAAQTPAPVVFSTYEAVDGRLMPAASLRSGIQAPDSRAGPAKGSGQTESGARDHFRQGGSRRRGSILFLAVSWKDCAVSAGFCPPGSGRKGRRQPHSAAQGYRIFAFKSLSKGEFLEAEFLLSDGQRSPAGMAAGEGSLQRNLAPPSGRGPRHGGLRSAQRLDATTGGCSGRFARSLAVIPPFPVRSHGPGHPLSWPWPWAAARVGRQRHAAARTCFICTLAQLREGMRGSIPPRGGSSRACSSFASNPGCHELWAI